MLLHAFESCAPWVLGGRWTFFVFASGVGSSTVGASCVRGRDRTEVATFPCTLSYRFLCCGRYFVCACTTPLPLLKRRGEAHDSGDNIIEFSPVELHGVYYKQEARPNFSPRGGAAKPSRGVIAMRTSRSGRFWASPDVPEALVRVFVRVGRF